VGYDQKNAYMLINLKGTWYPYWEIDLRTVSSLLAALAGESNGEVLRPDFDRISILQFPRSVVTSDAGSLACRELDDALGLKKMAGEMLADARTGNDRGARIAKAVHINGNAVAPMRAAATITSGSLFLTRTGLQIVLIEPDDSQFRMGAF
jgi:hypothetical protein